jgi:hypothetical protein
MIFFHSLVPFSTLTVLTMVPFLDYPNSLYSPADDGRDFDEVDSVSFLAVYDGMDEQEAMVTSAPFQTA